MDYLEVVARARIRAGHVDGVTEQAAEIVRLTRQRDAHTLRCDWFVNEDGTDLEVHEVFADEQGLAEHSMHIMEARARLFRDHAYDHRSTLYGEASEGFLALVRERMGTTPAVFTFLQGLGEPAPPGSWSPGSAPLELHAHMRVRPGEVEGFTRQVADIMGLTRELDTQTLRYDWFISEDGGECEVHEVYPGAQGLFEHNAHVMDARRTLFERYADGHRMVAFGEVAPELRALADKHAGGLGVYAFVEGLAAAAAA